MPALLGLSIGGTGCHTARVSLSTLVALITLAVLAVACIVGVVAAIRLVIRTLRMRDAPPTNLLRAGAPSGTDDPKVAFDRASGKEAWTRIGGGL